MQSSLLLLRAYGRVEVQFSWSIRVGRTGGASLFFRPYSSGVAVIVVDCVAAAADMLAAEINTKRAHSRMLAFCIHRSERFVAGRERDRKGKREWRLQPPSLFATQPKQHRLLATAGRTLTQNKRRPILFHLLRSSLPSLSSCSRLQSSPLHDLPNRHLRRFCP